MGTCGQSLGTKKRGHPSRIEAALATARATRGLAPHHSPLWIHIAPPHMNRTSSSNGWVHQSRVYMMDPLPSETFRVRHPRREGPDLRVRPAVRPASFLHVIPPYGTKRSTFHAMAKLFRCLWLFPLHEAEHHSSRKLTLSWRTCM